MYVLLVDEHLTIYNEKLVKVVSVHHMERKGFMKNLDSKHAPTDI